MRQRVQPPEWLHRGVQSLEESKSIDPAVDALGAVAGPLGSSRLGPVLRGEWLGHPLHPVLTDLPIGFWTSANVLDLVGGSHSRRAAQRLVGLGLLAVPLTAASGTADWGSTGDQRIGRVGVVHAAGNGLAAGLYFLSWRARRKGRHGRGVVLGLVGSVIATGAAYLGGRLSYGLGSGVEPRGGESGSAMSGTSTHETAVPLGLADLVDHEGAADQESRL